MARKKSTKAKEKRAVEAPEELPETASQASPDAPDADASAVAAPALETDVPAEGISETDAAAAEPAIAPEADEPTVEDVAAPAPPAPPTTPASKVVDKRRIARLFGFGGGEASAARPVDSGVSDARIAELQERVERARAEARADAEATRARLERHFETRVASARSEVVEAMLPVLDNLDRALTVPGAIDSPLYEGVAATRDLFVKRLGELGAIPVPSIGEPFDPTSHEAIDEVAVDDPARAGTVVEEVRRGFRIGDRLVRPAMVRVGKAAQTAPAGESD